MRWVECASHPETTAPGRDPPAGRLSPCVGYLVLPLAYSEPPGPANSGFQNCSSTSEPSTVLSSYAPRTGSVIVAASRSSFAPAPIA